jgi:excisionase family DNA binding protein
VQRFDTTTSQAENVFPTANIRKLPPLIPLPEAAQLLGISRASAYRYAQAGTLPIKRFGRRVYVITAKLQDLFEPMSSGRDAA